MAKKKGKKPVPGVSDDVQLTLRVTVKRGTEAVADIERWLRNVVSDLPDVTDVKIASVFDPKKPTYTCEKCGCPDVQHAMWVVLNTDDVRETFGSWCEGDSSFCPKCDDDGEPHQYISTSED